ncbi:MAG: sulfite exporter TauE/SafE family protein [Planctomycetales bacterium]|nr:sulfite exporter TauE/SafE family protein [Planctomycetales bacterium]
MSNSEIWLLTLTSFSVGLIHTLLGPDHYVPFVAMAQAGNWSRRKTLCVTAWCGLGHVAGSIIIGGVGIACGAAAIQLEGVEASRGDLAAWLLLAFGMAYLTWGLARAYVPRHQHNHPHPHSRRTEKDHAATAEGGGQQTQRTPQKPGTMTAWVLFVIFVLGPCEPLIPLLMYPAAQASPWAVALVVLAFVLATVATMVVAVAVLHLGLNAAIFYRLRRFSHAMAGFAVLTCGVLVKVGF